MSRSVHTSRAKFRKAFQFDYSNDEERKNVLGKIIDEKFLKRDLKEDAKRKRQSKKVGLRSFESTQPIYGVASKKARASSFAKDIVKGHERKGYGKS